MADPQRTLHRTVAASQVHLTGNFGIDQLTADASKFSKKPARIGNMLYNVAREYQIETIIVKGQP